MVYDYIIIHNHYILRCIISLEIKAYFHLNPLERGHIAYRTDDLAAFKAHLTENGIPFAHWGNAAVKGWDQIFFYDPDGNIIEVHQVHDIE